MTRSRRVFTIMLATALAGTVAILAAGQGQWTLPDTAWTAPEPLHVQVASSITKQKWVKAAAEVFSARGETTASGRPIVIDVTGVLSGDSVQAILDGRLKPAAWSPGEDNWIAELNAGWKLKSGKPAIAATCKPTVYAPLGIAIWKPMAEALGWPGHKISWKMLIDLAADPNGWSRYGHPEWGRLKIGYSHPQYSSAGLLFLTSAISAVLGSPGALQAADIYKPEVESALASLAKNTTKYGLSSADLLNLMARNGPQFLHAAAAFEQQAVQLNVERKQELRWPLAFVFPEEGTYWSNHPYCVLDGVPWVTAEDADAAQRFGDFLRTPDVQALASANYVRPIDAKVPVGEPLTLANGTDPAARPESSHVLPIPGLEASNAVIDLFLTTKRKATVLLVLDTSGSMGGEAIRAATEATRQFIGRLAPADRVGLVAFNDNAQILSDVEPVSSVGEALSIKVLNLVAGGGTNLYGAVCDSVALLRNEQEKDAANGDKRLYGMVLLSDGADKAGKVSEGRMFETCLNGGSEEGGIRAFTIAFGKDANVNVLQRIANASGGASFAADSQSIASAYLKISAEQ